MQCTRFYILDPAPGSAHPIRVAQTVESLRTALEDSNLEQRTYGLCVHAGCDRPSPDEVAEVCHANPGRVVVTEAARWALPASFTVVRNVVGTVVLPGRTDEMPVYLGEQGWGYELTPEERFAGILAQESSKEIRATAQWVAELVQEDPEIGNAILGAGVRDDATLAAHLGHLEPERVQYVLNARRGILQRLLARCEPSELARECPLWLRGQALRSLGLTVRTNNALEKHELHNISDLGGVSTSDLLSLRGFGRTCYADLRDALVRAYVKGPPEFAAHQGHALQGAVAAADVSWESIRSAMPAASRPVLVRTLPIGTRARNVFDRHGIEQIADLMEYDEESLTALRNFGQSALRTVKQALIDLVLASGGGQPLELQTSHTARVDAQDRAAVDTASQTRLLDNVILTLNQLPESHRRIVEGRLASDGERATLKDLADAIGVTRERVRQIANKSIDNIIKAEFWDDVLRDKLGGMLDGRHEPMFVHELFITDPWFSGFEDRVSYLCGVIEAFCDGQFHAVTVNDQTAVSRVNQKTWNRLRQDAHDVIEARVGTRTNRRELELLVRSLAEHAGATELASTLFEEVLETALFGECSDGSDAELLGLPRSVQDLVKAVLIAADSPLHYEEVARRAADLAGKSIDVHQIHNALGQVGLLFGRGCYGLRSHLRLDSAEEQAIIEATEAIVADGSEGRQWHCEELIELLRDAEVINDGCTPYELSIVLGDSKSLVYLGRLVWSSRSAGHTSSSDRYSVADLVEEVLREAGKPLPREAVLDMIQAKRGLSRLSVIQPSPNVVRLQRGQWGLVDRDLGLSADEVRAWLDVLDRELRSGDNMVHRSELHAIARKHGLLRIAGVSTSILRRLSVNDPRFEIEYGGYLTRVEE